MLNGFPEGFAENSLESVRQHRSTKLAVFAYETMELMVSLQQVNALAVVAW